MTATSHGFNSASDDATSSDASNLSSAIPHPPPPWSTSNHFLSLIHKIILLHTSQNGSDQHLMPSWCWWYIRPSGFNVLSVLTHQHSAVDSSNSNVETKRPEVQPYVWLALFQCKLSRCEITVHVIWILEVCDALTPRKSIKPSLPSTCIALLWKETHHVHMSEKPRWGIAGIIWSCFLIGHDLYLIGVWVGQHQRTITRNTQV